MKMRAPFRASAASRSSTSCACATTVSECSLASRTRSSMLPEKVFTPRSVGNRYQRLEEKSASGEALWGRTLNQPLMPQASATRPTSMASAGSSAGSRPDILALRGLCGGLLDQAFHGRGGLGAHATPVGEAVLGNADAFLVVLGDRVVETQALDEASVAAGPLVGNHDVEERTSFRTAAGESNDDHDLSLGGGKKFP